MANPYVFIVGCPRSGTTLLQRIADAHPQLAITPEAQWIPRRFKELKGLTPEDLPGLIPQLLEHPKFAHLKFGADELAKLLETPQPVSYADLVARIFDLYGQHRGKALVGNKTPGFVRRLDTFHALWPKARIVHLIRDGRDVCLSMAHWPKAQLKHRNFITWKDDPVSTAALWWELNVRLGRQYGNSLGPNLYYEIRYESLVRNPQKECAALCDFLDLPYDDGMLRFHEGRTKTDPDLNAKHAWLPIIPGLRDWQAQMRFEDVERFEAAAGNLVDELDYPRAIQWPRPEILEHAAKVREALAQDPNWLQTFPQSQAQTLEPALRIPGSRNEDVGAAGLSGARS